MKRTVVCLCGSCRFKEAFERANYEETMRGDIVLSVGFAGAGQRKEPTPEEKLALDALHLDKIAMADEVLVLNVGGYIGESTRKEIQRAELLGRKLRYLVG